MIKTSPDLLNSCERPTVNRTPLQIGRVERAAKGGAVSSSILAQTSNAGHSGKPIQRARARHKSLVELLLSRGAPADDADLSPLHLAWRPTDAQWPRF